MDISLLFAGECHSIINTVGFGNPVVALLDLELCQDLIEFNPAVIPSPVI